MDAIPSSSVHLSNPLFQASITPYGEYYQFGESPDNGLKRHGRLNRLGFLIKMFEKFVHFLNIHKAPHVFSTTHRHTPSLPHLANPRDTEQCSVGKYYQANIRVTETTEEGLAWKKTLIQSAETSIEFSPNYAGGSEFREILLLIAGRMSTYPNLHTHLLLNPDFLQREDIQLLNSLTQQFPERFVYCVNRPIIRQMHIEENHTKILVVDSKYFVLGGSTITSTLARETPKEPPATRRSLASRLLMPRSSRDIDIIGHGENTAQTIRTQFFTLFKLCETRTANTPATNRFFPVQATKERETCSAFHEELGLFRRLE